MYYVRFRLRVRVRVKVRVRVRFRFSVRVRVRVKVKVRVTCRVRVRVWVRAKVKVKVKLGLGLGSAKVECTTYSESGLVPSPSLFQNHVLTGVTYFGVYISDVILNVDLRIGRRFESGRRSESYICIQIY